MLLSMTGYGEAHFQSERLTVSIELRSLNNRHLKLSVRAPEPYNLLEPEFEKIIRKVVRRGSIQLNLRCQKQHSPQEFKVNGTALESYAQQILEMGKRPVLAGLVAGPHVLAALLALPGVVPEPGSTSLDAEEDWATLERVVLAALEKLQVMRREEGQAMAAEFEAYRKQIGSELEKIRERAPMVVEAYLKKMHDRVGKLVAELGVTIERHDLIKEVAIFAERCDVSEEIVRLASHLEQLRDMIQEPESPGRKLEFLTQEMFREANTIGSKASDVAIARHVVEIKAVLEKFRELVQNVE